MRCIRKWENTDFNTIRQPINKRIKEKIGKKRHFQLRFVPIEFVEDYLGN